VIVELPVYSPQISLGQLLTIGSILVSGIVAWVHMREKSDQYGKTLEEHGKLLGRLTSAQSKQARAMAKLCGTVESHDRGIARLVERDDRRSDREESRG
jgi:hypothetical protein